jgi:hypothetical protein
MRNVTFIQRFTNGLGLGSQNIGRFQKVIELDYVPMAGMEFPDGPVDYVRGDYFGGLTVHLANRTTPENFDVVVQERRQSGWRLMTP